MKKHDSFLGERITKKTLDWAQVSKEEAIKERQQDIWSDGILKKYPNIFNISVSEEDPLKVNIGFGTGWVNGERIHISQNDGFSSLNLSYSPDGLSAPMSTGNIDVPLADYTNEAINYIWIKHLDARDATYKALVVVPGEVYYPYITDGYEITIDTIHDPNSNGFADALYLGRVKAKGLGVPLDPITSWSYEDREYCHMTLQDGITDFNIVDVGPWVFVEELQQQEANDLTSLIFNLYNFYTFNDNTRTFGCSVNDLPLSPLTEHVYADVFSERGGIRGSIDQLYTTATWKGTASSTSTWKIGQGGGFYSGVYGSGSRCIQTKKLVSQTKPIHAFIASALTDLGGADSSILGTYDLSFDNGVTWKSGLEWGKFYRGGELPDSVSTKEVKIRINLPVPSAVWSYTQPLPTVTYYTSGFVIGGFAFICGGVNGAESNVTRRYDDIGNVWATRDTLNFARKDQASFVVFGFGSCTCGIQAGVPCDIHELYDNVSNAWTRFADAIVNDRTECAGFSLGEYGYIMGGVNEIDEKHATTERYDYITNTWLGYWYMNYSRNVLAGFSLNGYGYAVGGSEPLSGQGYSYRNERFDDKTQTWVTKSSIPQRLQWPHTVAYNNYAFIMGGRKEDNSITADVHRYDDVTDSWSSYTALQTARRSAAYVSLPSGPFIMGGYNQSSCEKLTINHVQIYGFAFKWYD